MIPSIDSLQQALAAVGYFADRRLATAVFLELNGVKASRASNDDVFELIMWIASDNPEIAEITARLQRVVANRRSRR